MKIFTCLKLLLLLALWSDLCDCLSDNLVPEIFFPFGRDEGDNVLPVGHNNCNRPIDIPYKIFNSNKLYVSSILMTESTAFITHANELSPTVVTLIVDLYTGWPS